MVVPQNRFIFRANWGKTKHFPWDFSFKHFILDVSHHILPYIHVRHILYMVCFVVLLFVNLILVSNSLNCPGDARLYVLLSSRSVGVAPPPLSRIQKCCAHVYCLFFHNSFYAFSISLNITHNHICVWLHNFFFCYCFAYQFGDDFGCFVVPAYLAEHTSNWNLW